MDGVFYDDEDDMDEGNEEAETSQGLEHRTKTRKTDEVFTFGPDLVKCGLGGGLSTG
jgi:hypothetical protein